jgi:ABC-type transport system involved in cytochrome c biogenesis permease subunit
LALAFVTSCVFLIVERRLKRRSAGALSGYGPNLQLLDLLNKQLAQLGFVAISLVVLSGGLWAVSQQKPVFSADTSVVSGLVTWLLLAFILHVRLVLKWSPKQVSRLTVIVTGSFFVSVFTVLLLAGRLTHVNL